jgi:pyruvate kinase
MAKTKIICTIGPSSDKPSVLEGLMQAGMSVARLNFSHGTHAQHEARIRAIRKAAKKAKHRCAILQDLAGYRIRIGHFQGGRPVPMKKGQVMTLTTQNILGNSRLVPFDYNGLVTDIKKGSLIYIDDGNLVLEVTGHDRCFLKARVQIGGLLKERKGINIPAFNIAFTGLTAKDEADVRVGIKHRVDYIAQSFVRDAKDMLKIRELAATGHGTCRLIAKIENHQGICNIDEIVRVSDGVMVARGDMGVAVPIHEIPMIQKMIIKKCNKSRKFVITATQMLETMIDNQRPKRAEVSDVANAILDGSDYVMLSGETAAGLYPVETVQMMSRIIDFTEKTRTMKIDEKNYCRLFGF